MVLKNIKNIITLLEDNNLFELYNLLNRLSSELFKSMYADGRTLTGVNTISLLLMSLFKNNDKILISDEECGVIVLCQNYVKD